MTKKQSMDPASQPILQKSIHMLQESCRKLLEAHPTVSVAKICLVLQIIERAKFLGVDPDELPLQVYEGLSKPEQLDILFNARLIGP